MTTTHRTTTVIGVDTMHPNGHSRRSLCDSLHENWLELTIPRSGLGVAARRVLEAADVRPELAPLMSVVVHDALSLAIN